MKTIVLIALVILSSCSDSFLSIQKQDEEAHHHHHHHHHHNEASSQPVTNEVSQPAQEAAAPLVPEQPQQNQTPVEATTEGTTTPQEVQNTEVPVIDQTTQQSPEVNVPESPAIEQQPVVEQQPAIEQLPQEVPQEQNQEVPQEQVAPTTTEQQPAKEIQVQPEVQPEVQPQNTEPLTETPQQVSTESEQPSQNVEQQSQPDQQQAEQKPEQQQQDVAQQPTVEQGEDNQAQGEQTLSPNTDQQAQNNLATSTTMSPNDEMVDSQDPMVSEMGISGDYQNIIQRQYFDSNGNQVYVPVPEEIAPDFNSLYEKSQPLFSDDMLNMNVQEIERYQASSTIEISSLDVSNQNSAPWIEKVDRNLPAEGDCIILYSDCSFSGFSKPVCFQGESAFTNYDVKSIYIPEGQTFTLFDAEEQLDMEYFESQECLDQPINMIMIPEDIILTGQKVKVEEEPVVEIPYMPNMSTGIQ